MDPEKCYLECIKHLMWYLISAADFVLLDNRDFSTAFFNSIPLSGSLAGTMLSSHSSPQLLPLDSSTHNSFGVLKPSTEPVGAAGPRPAGDSVSKDR